MMKTTHHIQYRHPSVGRFSDSVFSRQFIHFLVNAPLDMPAGAWLDWLEYEMGFGM